MQLREVFAPVSILPKGNFRPGAKIHLTKKLYLSLGRQLHRSVKGQDGGPEDGKSKQTLKKTACGQRNVNVPGKLMNDQ